MLILFVCLFSFLLKCNHLKTATFPPPESSESDPRKPLHAGYATGEHITSLREGKREYLQLERAAQLNIITI